MRDQKFEEVVAYRINVNGVVQGVGYRPFVYHIATELGLNGFVLNSGNGVIVEVEGRPEDCLKFIERLKAEKPPRAIVKTISYEKIPLKGHDGFRVEQTISEEVETLCPPDVAVCQDCLNELFNPDDRRYLYPFINCINCGPRFTILERLPYDRVNTSMRPFKMCGECEREYSNPMNRRFKAEPNACGACGPGVKLYYKDKLLRVSKPISEAARLINKGFIVAVKGYGGFHIACDATRGDVVSELRRRKKRGNKPFAIMVKNIEEAENIVELNDAEKKWLLHYSAPIILAKKREPNPIAEDVAPGMKYLGVFLPYTPIHHILMRGIEPPAIVLTSGNISEEPIIFRDREAFEKLESIADYVLTYNRRIVNFADDSVGFVQDGQLRLVRRSRGFVPEPIEVELNVDSVLAMGADLNNTFALAKKGRIFISQYMGDLENLSIRKRYLETIRRMQQLLNLKYDRVAYDLHPAYYSSQIGLSLNGEKIPVQHHYAHVLSAMAENNILNSEALGVAFDGIGYGKDGKLWGSEFIIVRKGEYVRRGHFKYVPMPGGEKAVTEPARMAFSYLYDAMGEDALKIDIGLSDNVKRALKNMVDKGINAPLTCGLGRMFDAVSALLGVCLTRTFEGEPAVMLEMVADMDAEGSYPFKILGDKEYVVDTAPIISMIVEEMKRNIPVRVISKRFHETIARITVELADTIRLEEGIKNIVLSGGVFQNRIVSTRVKRLGEERGLKTFFNNIVPTNDGGISLGQVVASSLAGEE
ncbi:MAG: carbamoyltransferase HypF [Candidatus Brockarchaeota archaeon]|nr:carbamoyltransferase HypF [Candidatus Brockarchaeota archaeon]